LDRDTIIRAIIAGLIVIALMIGWQWARPYFFPPEKPAQSQKGESRAPPVAPTTEPAKPPPSEKPAAPAIEALKAPALRAVEAPAPEPGAPPVRLGGDTAESLFDLEAEIDARGAGVRRLAIARHDIFKTVADRRLPADERAPMDLVTPDSPFPAFRILELRVRLKGADAVAKIDLSDKVWHLDAARTSASSATFFIRVLDGEDRPLLTVRKTLTVYPREGPRDLTPQYEMKLALEFESADDRVEKVGYILQGPPALPTEGAASRGGGESVVAGAWGEGKVDIARAPGKDIKKSEAMPEKQTLAGNGKLAWAGGEDKYFAVILIPEERTAEGTWVVPQRPSAQGTFAEGAEAAWVRVSKDATHDTAMPDVHILSKELPITRASPVVNGFAVFAGPKAHQYLEQYYSGIGLPDLIVWAQCCGPWQLPGLQGIGRFLVTLLDWFHALVPNYGIATILLVILLRIVMFPISRWSTKSMLEMQKMAPKMQKIREEFANDPKRMQEEMAKIGGLKQMGGCLPMFIQMPIWIGLYGSLNAAIQLRHAAFLPSSWLPGGSLFLQDLSAPDALIHWQTPFLLPGQDIPLLNMVIGWIQTMLSGGSGGITSFNLLPIFVGVTFYLQQKMTPQPPAASPQMEQQRKMMNFMMIFFALMLYSVPSGLCLYIVTSSVLGFFEQRYLKKHMAQPAPAAEAPQEKPAEAKEQSLAKGREKTLAEKAESWVKRHLGPQEKTDDREGKKRRKR